MSHTFKYLPLHEVLFKRNVRLYTRAVEGVLPLGDMFSVTYSFGKNKNTYYFFYQGCLMLFYWTTF